jgi:hypothetical protein
MRLIGDQLEGVADRSSQARWIVTSDRQAAVAWWVSNLNWRQTVAVKTPSPALRHIKNADASTNHGSAPVKATAPDRHSRSAAIQDAGDLDRRHPLAALPAPRTRHGAAAIPDAPSRPSAILDRYRRDAARGPDIVQALFLNGFAASGRTDSQVLRVDKIRPQCWSRCSAGCP